MHEQAAPAAEGPHELEYLRLLQRVSSALAEALTPDEVLDAVIRYGVPAAEAEAGLIALLARDDPDTVEIAAAVGFSSEQLDPWRRVPLTTELPYTVAIRTGEPLFFSTTADLLAQFPQATPHARSHARAFLPLLVEREAIGALALTYRDEVTFDEERRTRKLTIARQAAQALGRARHYAAELALRERMQFLAEASELLGSSLDYGLTLARLADLAVLRLADWCEIDVVGDDGEIARLTISHWDPAKRRWAVELQQRYPLDPAAPNGAPNVIRTGEPEFIPEISDELLVAATHGDEELLAILRELGLRSAICVPLVARGRVLGALTLIRETRRRRYGQLDLTLATELARRAALAVDNAHLFREAERRAAAARALGEISDGVLLVDGDSAVRYLNPAAARLLGLDHGAIGRLAVELIPEWDQFEHAMRRDPSTPAIVPISRGDTELWFASSVVRFDDGAVYTLRNVTEERLLERTRNEFVATASHELRTPVTGIFGAVRTLRRRDIELTADQRNRFLQIIDEEAQRLTRIVDQMLAASRLEAGEMRLEPAPCDLAPVLESLSTSVFGERLVVSLPGDLVALCDVDRLRQVLLNLLDNAVKYSPDGGEIRLAADGDDRWVRIEVRDRGIGLPTGSEERVFEKFYRLDPEQTGGVGGTGLGLYISRELVNRMGGRIQARSNHDGGSTFTVELPRA